MRKLKNAELKRLDVDGFKNATKSPIILILDNVRSSHNVGSIFRTADAFRVQEILLCGITATPPHKDIRKTALGATESVQWQYFENTIDAIQNLQSKGIVVLAVEQAEGSTSLSDFNALPDTTYALVFGHEVKGVSQAVVSAANEVLEIPQLGTKHSLNVSVSVGLVVWELFSSLSKRF
jgi:23S rRNA (guanosine2251-2'-O)-methyltransferase